MCTLVQKREGNGIHYVIYIMDIVIYRLSPRRIRHPSTRCAQTDMTGHGFSFCRHLFACEHYTAADGRQPTPGDTILVKQQITHHTVVLIRRQRWYAHKFVDVFQTQARDDENSSVKKYFLSSLTRVC